MLFTWQPIVKGFYHCRTQVWIQVSEDATQPGLASHKVQVQRSVRLPLCAFQGQRWEGAVAALPCSYFGGTHHKIETPGDTNHLVRYVVNDRGLFTAGWFDVREKYCSSL